MRVTSRRGCSRAPELQRGDRIAIMLPNVLQYPIALFGALRAGLTVVNTNPLYTARELEHQLTDSGAKAIIILENFAHTLEQVIERTSLEHVIVTGVGDQLGWPKSAVVNLVVRHVRKQVPPLGAAGRTALQRRARTGQVPAVRAGRDRSRRHCVPAVHRRHDRRRQGRDAHPPQHDRERVAGAARGSALPRSSARTRSSRRCRCTTSSRSRRTGWCSSSSARTTC